MYQYEGQEAPSAEDLAVKLGHVPVDALDQPPQVEVVVESMVAQRPAHLHHVPIMQPKTFIRLDGSAESPFETITIEQPRRCLCAGE